jgi:hypothetical protein
MAIRVQPPGHRPRGLLCRCTNKVETTPSVFFKFNWDRQPVIAEDILGGPCDIDTHALIQ